MNDSLLRQLEHEVNRFRAWADGHDLAYQHGSWECDYSEWPEFYAAFRDFLNDCPYQTWGAEVEGLLLYAIARDNECGVLAGEAAKVPDRALLLARASLHSTERDAKWHLAVRISHLSGRDAEVEAVLLELVSDEDEYVRRQALMGLGRIHSPAVEALAEVAWETGDEYQRMGGFVCPAPCQLAPARGVQGPCRGRREGIPGQLRPADTPRGEGLNSRTA